MVYSGSMSKKPQKHTGEKTEKEPQRKTPTFMLEMALRVNQGWLVWKEDQLPARIDWDDSVIKHGLSQCIKYARLVQHKASSKDAQGADALGFRYVVQLALEGIPHHKTKHLVGSQTVGADLGPSSIALLQRDLCAADLPVFLDPDHLLPSCAQYVVPWEGAEARLQAAHERVIQRANEGQNLPRSFGIPRAGARQPESRSEPTREPAFSLWQGRLEAWKERENPRAFMPGSFQL